MRWTGTKKSWVTSCALILVKSWEFKQGQRERNQWTLGNIIFKMKKSIVIAMFALLICSPLLKINLVAEATNEGKKFCFKVLRL